MMPHDSNEVIRDALSETGFPKSDGREKSE